VYAAGYYTNSDGDEVACYWKNGIRTDLRVSDHATSSEARAEAIAISGGDVYIAGYYLDSGGSWHDCYWKNGNQQDIMISAYSVDELVASDIFVDGNDIYVAGYFYDESKDEWSARYWKNSEAALMLKMFNRAMCNSRMAPAEKQAKNYKPVL